MPTDYRQWNRPQPPAPAPQQGIPQWVWIGVFVVLVYLLIQRGGSGPSPVPPGPGPSPNPPTQTIEWDKALIVVMSDAASRSADEVKFLDDLIRNRSSIGGFRVFDTENEDSALDSYRQQAQQRVLGDEWVAVVMNGTKLAWMGPIPDSLEALKKAAQ